MATLFWERERVLSFGRRSMRSRILRGYPASSGVCGSGLHWGNRPGQEVFPTWRGSNPSYGLWEGRRTSTGSIKIDKAMRREISPSRREIEVLGVSHHDLPPDNILWNPELGRALIIDFHRSALVDRRLMGKRARAVKRSFSGYQEQDTKRARVVWLTHCLLPIECKYCFRLLSVVYSLFWHLEPWARQRRDFLYIYHFSIWLPLYASCSGGRLTPIRSSEGQGKVHNIPWKTPPFCGLAKVLFADYVDIRGECPELRAWARFDTPPL